MLSVTLMVTCRPSYCPCCVRSLFWWSAFLKASLSSSDPGGESEVLSHSLCLRPYSTVILHFLPCCGTCFWIAFHQCHNASYLQDICTDVWCPPSCRSPRSLCWSSDRLERSRWSSLCCRLFSSWRWECQHWPPRTQRGHRICRWARLPLLLLAGPGHNSKPLRKGTGHEREELCFSSSKLVPSLKGSWLLSKLTFTFFLRSRVTCLPAIEARLEVWSGHPALNPAVVVPKYTQPETPFHQFQMAKVNYSVQHLDFLHGRQPFPDSRTISLAHLASHLSLLELRLKEKCRFFRNPFCPHQIMSLDFWIGCPSSSTYRSITRLLLVSWADK